MLSPHVLPQQWLDGTDCIPSNALGIGITCPGYILICCIARKITVEYRAIHAGCKLRVVFSDFDLELWLFHEAEPYSFSRLAADGQYVKAAESLESTVKGHGGEWLADAVTQRCREIRDQKGSGTPLICDAAFLRKLIYNYFTASKSDIAGTTHPGGGLTLAAAQFGDHLIQMFLSSTTQSSPPAPTTSSSD